MAETVYVPDAIFDGSRLVTGVCALNSGEIVPADALGAQTPRISIPGVLAPALFDIQVNGGGGVMFNNTPTPKGIETIAQAHFNLGTGAILPTVITDHPDVLSKAVAAIIACPPSAHIVGIHIEGPHIDPKRPGTHKPEFIRPVDQATIDHIKTLRAQQIPVLITLAPEATAPGQIRQLREMGAVVALGHSDADAATTNQAIAEGANLVTHLFNAMSQMQGRAPGMTGAALGSDIYCSIIADGIHVAPAMVGLACRARPQPHRMIAVSDAMATVGGPDHFALYGNDIQLDQGRLIDGAGNLAGAHICLAEAVANLCRLCDLSLETALQMAITNPARLMGVDERFKFGRGAMIHIDPAFKVTPFGR